MLDRYLKKQRVFLNPSVTSRESLLELLTQKAMDQGLITDRQAMLNGLEEKEQAGVMELKSHVLLPHTRGDFVKELFMNLVVAPKGIFYRGAQKNLAKIIILVGIPQEDQQYLRLLAMISRLIIKDELIEELLSANVVEDILFTIKKFSVQVRDEKDESPKKYILWLVLNQQCDTDAIGSLLAEVGVSFGLEFEGKKIGNASVFLPFMGSFGFSGGSKYTRIFSGLTDDPKAAYQLFNLLKQEGIDLSQKGVGMLYELEAMEAFGGEDEDLDF